MFVRTSKSFKRIIESHRFGQTQTRRQFFFNVEIRRAEGEYEAFERYHAAYLFLVTVKHRIRRM